MLAFAKRSARWDAMAAAAAFWAVVGLVAVAVGVCGLSVRDRAWAATDGVRFVGDIDNAFRQGTQTLNVGYLDRYDDEYAVAGRAYENMSLDYGPARLLIATVWSRWVHEQVEPPMIVPPGTATSWLARPAGGRSYVDRGNFYQWAQQMRHGRDDPPRQDVLCRPLLVVNLTGEAVTAAGLFLLVRRFASGGGARGVGGPFHVGPRRVRGAVLGLVAAGLFWLDPALIWNAHCWPQWDSWVLPFFVWAVLAAVCDGWVVAGALVTLGAMFKGQSLFAAPLLVMWPVFQGRVGAAVRWVVGAAAGAAAAAGVWLVRTPGHYAGYRFVGGETNTAAVGWVVTAAVAIGLLTWVMRVRVSGYVRGGVLFAAAVLTLWPFADPTVRDAIVAHGTATAPTSVATPLAIVLGGLIAGVALARWLPRRSLPTLCLGWTAAAVLLCAPVFGGSTAWFQTGVAHGTTARQMMASGEDDNLANLLNQRWGWELMDPAVTIPPGPVAQQVAAVITKADEHAQLDPAAAGRPVELPLKYLLVGVWFAATAACAAGAAMHHRTGNVRFLVAVATPWVVLFAVTGQMHQRYLLWGACLTAAAAAVSPGLLVTHLALSAVAISQEARSMFAHPNDQPYWNQRPPDAAWWRVVVGSQPGFGWAVLAIAAIYLYLSVRPGRRMAPSPGTPGEGRGEGELELRDPLDVQTHPHPNPLPAYRERGPDMVDGSVP